MTSPDGDTELVQLQQHVPFTMVENTIIQSLGDYVALGLYLDMRSRPPGWRINLANLSKTKKQGRDSLTGAMNTLIENGLVFRIKFQRPTGQWATRIYVAQRPVTLDELLAVRDSYSGRCTIITSAALIDGANLRAAKPARNSTSSFASTSSSETCSEDAKLLVAPTAGKPTVGEPDVGQPTIGEPGTGQPEVGAPTVGEPAPNYQDLRAHNPPPAPSESTHSPVTTGEEERQTETDGAEEHVASAMVDETRAILDSVAIAWPMLGHLDLQRLHRPIDTALRAGVDTRSMTEHLTTNPGGVRSPIHVLLARCANHPQPQTLGRTKTPWCGDCLSPQHRWVEVGLERRPVPCSRCNDGANRTTSNDAAQGPQIQDDERIGDVIARTRAALRSGADRR